MGIARTLEYNWKLKNVYDKFFTNRAKTIAAGQQVLTSMKICIKR